MSKQKTIFFCQSCGNESPRWIGKCPACGEWNKYVEEKVVNQKTSKKISNFEKTKPVLLNELEIVSEQRIPTGLAEFDRVLGGGIVVGSVILVAGDPGIGKSTLMLQIAQSLSNRKVLYVTGEESQQQIKMRASRLNLDTNKFYVYNETDLDSILNSVENIDPEILIIDSIQTIYKSSFENVPGSITQIRECTAQLMQIAKYKGTAVFIVGHITKDGVIAGPKVLEHIVDTVLQFEGDNNYSYRILRTLKNRFGSTNEIGIFEMVNNGLREVQNPSEIFLSQRQSNASGSSIVATIEGTRPILVEVQALVTTSSYGMPQRSSTGFDYRRLTVLLAVLEKRMGLRLGQYDVITNIAGGVKVDEPAVDLGIITSVVSSLKDLPVKNDIVVIGEVGLSGEVRSVNYIEKRIKEVKKLGFKKIILPKSNLKEIQDNFAIEVIGISNIREGLENILA